MADWIVIAGQVLMLLVRIAGTLYLGRCIWEDAKSLFRGREEKEPLEAREQRCLAELRQIRKEMARRDGRRSAMQVYTFTGPAWKREQIF
ncbi:MAG: hypothetical protein HFG58_16470 [Lachnospiraceae bacterium]|nr:hypothetical protein [Lachnospiraceae bacterium]